MSALNARFLQNCVDFRKDVKQPCADFTNESLGRFTSQAELGADATHSLLGTSLSQQRASLHTSEESLNTSQKSVPITKKRVFYNRQESSYNRGEPSYNKRRVFIHHWSLQISEKPTHCSICAKHSSLYCQYGLL